jgi:hypothetical protein
MLISVGKMWPASGLSLGRLRRSDSLHGWSPTAQHLEAGSPNCRSTGLLVTHRNLEAECDV